MTLLANIRSSTLQLWISLVLIIQLTNFSIDPADHSFSEDLKVNEIESFTELWIEVILGNGDIFQETDEGDEHNGKRDTPSNSLFTPSVIEFSYSSEPPRVQHNTYSRIDFESPETTISTPPPRSLGR